jgi:hypothetical protein
VLTYNITVGLLGSIIFFKKKNIYWGALKTNERWITCRSAFNFGEHFFFKYIYIYIYWGALKTNERWITCIEDK